MQLMFVVVCVFEVYYRHSSHSGMTLVQTSLCSLPFNDIWHYILSQKINDIYRNKSTLRAQSSAKGAQFLDFQNLPLAVPCLIFDIS